MPIQWREQMSVGNTLIDLDHRLLICMINNVELALMHPEETGEHLSLVLTELESYTQDHFAREERIQLKVQYPKYADHKVAHQDLVARLRDLRDDILRLEGSAERRDEAPRLTRLLREWLLVHVLGDDMKMKPLLTRYPPELAP